jgi:hypothetical protein
MTAEELRERLQRGDLDALLDPSFLLHLLGDGPFAEWWAEGIRPCFDSVHWGYASALDQTVAARTVVQWAREVLENRHMDLVNEMVKRFLDEQDPKERRQRFINIVDVAMTEKPWRHLFELAHLLRASLPSPPAQVDAALGVLDRNVVR